VPNLDDSPIRDADEAPIVAVLEYSSQQAESIVQALSSSGADVYVTSNWAMCTSADGLIIPGADSDFDIHSALRTVRTAEMIDARLLANRAVLVVGNAFNALFESREEGSLAASAMNQWPGYSDQMAQQNNSDWLSVEAASESKLLRELDAENFVFENSHAVFEWVLDAKGPLHAPRVSWTKSVPRYIAAVENGPLIATQFRPELSNAAGRQVLNNWVASL
jgi:glutamine amidotransferase